MLLTVLLGTGCIGLKNKDVAALQGDTQVWSVCPGSTTNLLLGIELDDGRVIKPTGPSGGSVAWKSIRVQVDGAASVGRRGVLRVSPDPADTWGKPIRWKVTLPDHPGVKAEGVLGIRYDCDYEIGLGGVVGSDGDPGMNGDDGTDKEPGGEDGQDGDDGEDGGDAAHATVRIAYAVEPLSKTPVLQAEVIFEDGQVAGRFAFEPERGSLFIDAAGGDGGDGGRGGDGGDGDDCDPGADPRFHKGRGGNGGDGGDGGRGGDAGAVRMIVDARAAKMLRNVHVDLSGGRGGEHGEAGVGGEGRCGGKDGTDGRSGRSGRSGRDGREPRVDLDHVAPMW